MANTRISALASGVTFSGTISLAGVANHKRDSDFNSVVYVYK